ncbi:MAG: hypothetical protein E7621_01635 [Ruminococcaceae bacterium]|nr:hypothetical protein [Oscillospiraceae bacterium]
MNYEKKDLIFKAYDLLCDVTPKKNDCGLLCGGACCKENSSHGEDGGQCGMLILPGEKELLEGAEEFSFVESHEGDMLVCSGRCLRELRPFACRIFPFYPKINEVSGKIYIKILPDPRASGICPIFNDPRRRKTHITFLRNAKKAVRILINDADIRKELISQSDMITDIEALRKKILN